MRDEDGKRKKSPKVPKVSTPPMFHARSACPIYPKGGGRCGLCEGK
jgi:hypothetical protein